MNAFENATKFFVACETALGWDACKPFVQDGATFTAQSEPLVEVDNIETYCQWIQGFGTVTAPNASYTLHSSSFDEENNTAMFFATYHAKHTGEGGPVPPTKKSTNSHYVYILKMDVDGKVAHMTKVWNAPWAMQELGWA